MSSDREQIEALLSEVDAFGRFLEAEWHNGHLDDAGYDRLNRDLGGIVEKHARYLAVLPDSGQADAQPVCDLPRPTDLTDPNSAADYAYGCERCGHPWHEHQPRPAQPAANPSLDRAMYLIENYLWNEDGEDDDWLLEARDLLMSLGAQPAVALP